MATIKVKYRPLTDDAHEGTIYYQINHDRKSRQLITDYRILESEWDEKRLKVITSKNDERNTHMLSIRDHIRLDLERFTRIIRKLDDKGFTYTVDDVIDEFNRYSNEYSLFNFMKDIIGKLKQKGKIRTSETYAAALSSFKSFLASHASKVGNMSYEDIMLDRINSDIMEAYEAWHQSRGIVPNTISFYNRILRAVYNRAVDDDIIENRYPFRRVYTGVDKTVKRALPIRIVSKLNALNLADLPALDYARDMFMISFMLRGMSFVDMAYLRKSDLSNGYIFYRRRKTGQMLTIEWTKEMQRILDKYPENSSDYLLPIIRHRGVNERSAYHNVGYNINHSLKTIGRLIGIKVPLTMYVARHSWASAAKSKGIPISVISEGMGHDSETTTRIYLASLDTSVVDKANSLILKSL